MENPEDSEERKPISRLLEIVVVIFLLVLLAFAIITNPQGTNLFR